MIKTTRIKHTQAPLVVIDDLSPQCNGVKQTFTLQKAVPEYAPHCLIFNGQLYENTSYHEWYTLSADRKKVTTNFQKAPTPGPHKNLIFMVGATGGVNLALELINEPSFETYVRSIVREELNNGN